MVVPVSSAVKSAVPVRPAASVGNAEGAVQDFAEYVGKGVTSEIMAADKDLVKAAASN